MNSPSVETSSEVSNLSEASHVSNVCNFPEQTSGLSTEITEKEERSGFANPTVNFSDFEAQRGLAQSGGEVNQLSPLDKSVLDLNFEVCRDNSTEETELKMNNSNFSELSAKPKGVNMQSKLPSIAEVVPRTVHDRKRPAKYEDFDTNFVRRIRAKRLEIGKISRNTACQTCGVICELETFQSEPKSLTQSSRIVRQKRIETKHAAWILHQNSAQQQNVAT